MSRRQDVELTAAETRALSGPETPEMIRSFIERPHMGAQVSAYRKVAAAARAEREALTEVALLGIARAQAGGAPRPRPDPPALSSDRVALEARIEEQRRQIAALTAAGAEVIHGG